MIVIQENDLAIASYDEDLGLILFETKNFLANKNTSLIQALLKSVIKFADENNVIGEIVDLTNLRGNFNPVIEYLVAAYYPEVAKRGMKRAAYVVSKDSLSRRLVKRIINDNNVMETMAFDDYEQAKKWVINS